MSTHTATVVMTRPDGTSLNDEPGVHCPQCHASDRAVWFGDSTDAKKMAAVHNGDPSTYPVDDDATIIEATR